ncbi:MAG: polyprenyl synthetase family protein [Anaerolineales bacterium]|nr:polyprenyl synthetase family protein [Anaerolineales bacterium]
MENTLSPLKTLAGIMRPALQNHLRSIIQAGSDFQTGQLPEMLSYQLGWTGEGAGSRAQGKQIRPLLVLLTMKAGGGRWQAALPAASAVELLHNFSLIHDDIQDNSPTRRGRPSVWKRWGKAQAINTGDAMFALANRSLLDLSKSLNPRITLQACLVFQRTTLQLTQGQHLDLAFENEKQISLDQYWEMISGKTAALLGTAMELGALCAQVSRTRKEAFREFGLQLGLAFQVQDDILGIWGETEIIGKSNTSDLVTGKKTLPIIYGLAQGQSFSRRWKEGPIHPGQASDIARLLEDEGARAFAQKEADRLTKSALDALLRAKPEGKAGEALKELAKKLLKRKG